MIAPAFIKINKTLAWILGLKNMSWDKKGLVSYLITSYLISTYQVGSMYQEDRKL